MTSLQEAFAFGESGYTLHFFRREERAVPSPKGLCHQNMNCFMKRYKQTTHQPVPHLPYKDELHARLLDDKKNSRRNLLLMTKPARASVPKSC